MSGETRLTIIGALTADPEMRFTPSGAGVANFTVASNSRHFDKASGEWVDDPALFMRCSVWREQAENVAESLVKGTRVTVVGNLVQREYTTREGEKRTVVELQAEEVSASLRFATAKVTRAQRQGSGGQVPQRGGQQQEPDPWATGGAF